MEIFKRRLEKAVNIFGYRQSTRNEYFRNGRRIVFCSGGRYGNVRVFTCSIQCPE